MAAHEISTPRVNARESRRATAAGAPGFEELLGRATRLRAPELCPELLLHLGDDLSALWCADEASRGATGTPPPYWGVAWPGGQALARYLLDHPGRVAGRRVLDVGSGSGIAAIAAALAGAAHVEASDTDERSVRAIAANARANGVAVAALHQDLVGTAGGWDVVLAADLWYERFFAGRVTGWLRELRAQGADVLAADPGRAYFPRAGRALLARYALPPARGEPSLEGAVWALSAPRA